MPRYTVQKRLVSIGRDYDVRDDDGQVVFKIDGKLRFARTFVVRDRDGKALLSVREKLMALDPVFEIKAGERLVATVRRTTTSGADTDEFEIWVAGASGAMLQAQGQLLFDGVRIQRGQARVGSVSRQQGRVVHEVFQVTAAADEDQALMLAIAMAIVETDSSRGEDRSS